MASRIKLLLVVIFLAALGGGVAAYKHIKLGLPLRPGALPEQWLVDAKITFIAPPDGGKVGVRLSLPAVAVEEGIGQEAGSVGYNYFVEKNQGEYTAIWASEKQAGNQAIYYRISFPNRQKSGGEPMPNAGGGSPVIEPPAFSGALEQAANRVVQRARAVSSDPDSLFVGLLTAVNAIDATQEVGILRKRYEEEAGDRSALPVLGIDLLNLAGVPARLAYGVRLEEARGSQQALRLIEYYDGAVWKVRSPDEPASTLDPAKYFVWNRGGGPLLEVNGDAEASQVSFTVIRSLIPLEKLTDLRDSPLMVSTIFGLPASEQAVFRYVVLIPLGAFVVVVLRNLIGVATLGTFMPVLLALALLEIPLRSGLIMFTVIVGAGLWFRFLLSRLNMLVVPRVAACVVIVTLLMMVLSVVSYKLGMRDGLQITLFPMIILAWTIERMSLIWEEEGKRSAILQVGGSLVVAVIAYLFMSIKQVQYWAFYFPELLLVLLAFIILIGRYTGYRLSELFRFRDFKEA
jgi:hypothetical protein